MVDFVNMLHRPVYWRIGNVKDSQTPRFIKAPFDIVIIDGVEYVQPIDRGGATAGSSGEAYAAILGTDSDTLGAWQNALDDKGFTDQVIFMDKDGTGNGSKDEWQSQQFFDVL